MTEKKFTYILISFAVLAILIVILVNIPWGGDKAKIRKEFGNLEKDHVYETITLNEVFKKQNSDEQFQLFVGSSQTVSEKSFAYEANRLAKQYNLKTIYYLDSSKLTDIELINLKHETNSYAELPSLFYFEPNEGKSTTPYISGLKELENFDNNWRNLLTQYFLDCYGE